MLRLRNRINFRSEAGANMGVDLTRSRVKKYAGRDENDSFGGARIGRCRVGRRSYTVATIKVYRRAGKACK